MRRCDKQLEKLLGQTKGHVHLVGICGIGMAGLACLLKESGFKVTGCDIHRNQLADWLEGCGINVMTGQDSEHLAGDVDWVIRSSAVSPENKEVKAAVCSGLDVFLRGEVLASLFARYKTSVAVSGTHGKTTTTAFVVQMLLGAGRCPSWFIGSELPSESGVDVAGHGSGNDVIIAEADESDTTASLYQPDITVVTNIEFDHMEHFESVDAFDDCFATLIRNTQRLVLLNADDDGVRRVSERIVQCGRALSFGLSVDADIRAENIIESESGQSFVILRGAERLGDVTLNVMGIHNVYNALAATAVCLDLGLSFDEIRTQLARVVLPCRRFECVAQERGVQVVSDYAHHPTEVSALVSMALKTGCKRLLAVFQPHRYSRTLALGKDFPGAFKGIDELILVPVYPASEEPMKGGCINDLYMHFRDNSLFQQKDSLKLALSLEQSWAYLRRILREGDLLLIIGAGDIVKIAQWAKMGIAPDVASISPELLSVISEDQALGRMTTMGVGGNADLWAVPESFKELQKIIMFSHANKTPLHLLGGGSNVLISDMGVRGITVRLSGVEFKGIRKSSDTRIVVGAGVALSKLLDWLSSNGFSGLEFLSDIPGTLGGALRMNAGAFGSELDSHVAWIRCLNVDGQEYILSGDDLDAEYRNCRSLLNRVAVEVELVVTRGGVKEAEQLRSDIAEKKKWLRGVRSAGSVFKNPIGLSEFTAGQLLEKAGAKNMHIGGANVSSEHANVIIAGPDANASDVVVLIEMMRAAVLDVSGIKLEKEIIFFG